MWDPLACVGLPIYNLFTGTNGLGLIYNPALARLRLQGIRLYGPTMALVANADRALLLTVRLRDKGMRDFVREKFLKSLATQPSTSAALYLRDDTSVA